MFYKITNSVDLENTIKLCSNYGISIKRSPGSDFPTYLGYYKALRYAYWIPKEFMLVPSVFGTIRDFSNMLLESFPVKSWWVSICIKLRFKNLYFNIKQL